MHRTVKIRALVIGMIFTFCFTGLIARMYWVQVVQASSLQQKAINMWQDNEVLPASRGIIMDRNGIALAENGNAYTIAVSPKIIAANQQELEDNEARQKKLGIATLSVAPDELAHTIAHGVAAILSVTSGDDPAVLENKIFALTEKKKSDGSDLAVEVEIRNEGLNVDSNTKAQIDHLIENISEKYHLTDNIGLNSEQSSIRYYPFNSLAAQVLGFINRDGQPIGGLESTLNSLLTGKPGMLNVEKDTQGVELANSKRTYVPVVNGDNVQLTIDRNIQYYAESAVEATMAQYHPKNMTAIVVNPQTMEVLAMASAPTFDPNKYWQADSQDSFTNRAISDQHEPGSTFKIVTLAGTVAENLFDPNEIYQSGSVNITGVTLNDYNNGLGWGKISFLDGLLHSSNVAFVKLGQKLGPENLRHFINDFGFGQKTGIDLPNEASGIIGMKYPVEYATATYGQGEVVVTAIQLVAAYAAIANGGKLMQPHVIKKITNPNTGGVIQSVVPKVVRQVVTPAVAKQTSLYLEQVVSNQEIGTGKKAYENGYRIAGKTGTGSILNTDGKGYSDTEYLISFIGYAPVENPQVLVAVIIDQPDLNGDFRNGSNAWAPAFNAIMSQSLRYLGIPANGAADDVAANNDVKTIPDLSGQTINSAQASLDQIGLPQQSFGDGNQVISQFPPAGTEISMTRAVYLKTSNKVTDLPDLSGKSLRDTMEICTLLNLKCKASGDGYVTSQTSALEGGQQVYTFHLRPLDEPTPVPTILPAGSPSVSPSVSPADSSTVSPAVSATPSGQ